MNRSDKIREVFYPLFVAGLVGSVWWVGYTRSSNDLMLKHSWPAIDPALVRRAMAMEATDEPSRNAATTQPTVISSISPGAQ